MREEEQKRERNKERPESREIVLDSGGEEWKRRKDMTGGLLRLPVFVIQHAVAMNRGARRPGTSSSLPIPLSSPPPVSGDVFAASAAETEQPSSVGHLAECLCHGRRLDQPDSSALPAVDGA